jgi:hypothetical protein
LSEPDRAAATPSAAQIGGSTTWSGSLFRNRFRLAVTHGAVSEIKLKCERQLLIFKYDPGLQYVVSPTSGPCGIEVIGDPETTFNLIQY